MKELFFERGDSKIPVIIDYFDEETEKSFAKLFEGPEVGQLEIGAKIFDQNKGPFDQVFITILPNGSGTTSSHKLSEEEKKKEWKSDHLTNAAASKIIGFLKDESRKLS